MNLQGRVSAMGGMPSSTTAPRVSRILPWRLRTIRGQLGLMLGVMIALLSATIGFTSYELNLRKHDYLILNLSGQLRVIAQMLVDQSATYLGDVPDNHDKYARDLKFYYHDLQMQIALFDKIIRNFEERRLDAELTGHSGAIQCTWDAQSRSQLSQTAATWRRFQLGMLNALGDDADGPRTISAAEFIVANGEPVVTASHTLSTAFQTMMEAKLDHIRYFQWGMGGLALLVFGVLFYGLRVTVLQPLATAQRGFARVAQGAFGHQVVVDVDNEIGRMTEDFNSLSMRIDALFRLASRINQGTTLEQTLHFVREEFQHFVPVDWIGVLVRAPADSKRWVLERFDAELGCVLDDDNAGLSVDDFPVGVLDRRVAAAANPAEIPGLPAALSRAGMCSFALVPLAERAEGGGILVFAAHVSDAYAEQDLELLANVSSHVSHVLDRTLVVEALVVAAVNGLAKLAESRDPETGDHLLRMARYSAIVAEELGREGAYRDQISPAYVRDILRFAPMHDIGKVGISDGILLKPGKLDAAEFAAMQQHPLIGGEVLRRCESQVNALDYSIFGTAIDIAECHHEKFDGKGYPRGLLGQAVPLCARIVAVADVFDALTSKRPYKEAWPVEQALATLHADAGGHFDPEIIAAFDRSLPRILQIYERYKHI